MELQSNPQLELAFDYIRETSTSLFLTGKAGSGKTTFLNRVKQHGGKRLVVAAPTGVAAINAGGVTIHSLFQLPLGLHLPNVVRREEHRRYSSQKLNLIRCLELLVIDEISMVRADLLDALDEALRRFRKDDRPFGNVQLLMIGDLHQLPPVVKPEDWEILQDYYDTPYFFGSRALQQTEHVTVELKHIYRQSDTEFIDLLNKVRDNRLDNESLRWLNSRYVHGFRPPDNESHITLTSTNAVAHEINNRSLALLQGKSRTFEAKVEGDFPANAYPTDERLEFKRGAQVMFIRNDIQPEKRFFNGKLGRITDMDEDFIYVRCDGESDEIAVEPAEWKNIRYAFNQETKEVEEQVLGMFVQYPLKLAWAITIHKSQGLTFDRAIIDAADAFAHGQVYVALSRCRTFEGIVLLSPIHYTSVKTDPVVQEYSAEAERNAPGEQDILQAKRRYQCELIQALFNFDEIADSLGRLRSIYQEHENTLTVEAVQQVSMLARKAHEALNAIADKFQPQLTAYLEHAGMPEAHGDLQGRICKASSYFTDKLTGLLQDAQTLPTQTDNQAVRQSVLRQLERLQLQLFTKRALFAASSQGFSTLKVRRAQMDAELDFVKQVGRPSQEDTVPPNAPHPELYAQLLKYRKQKSEEQGISPRAVLTSESLLELVSQLPTNQHLIRRIRGIARKRLERYGKDIEGIIKRYCEAKQISLEKVRAKPSVSSTKQASFELFQSGLTVEEVARDRGLSVSTIAGHLAVFVALNQLDVHRLLAKEKLTDIEQFCSAHPKATVGDAHNHFGAKYGYGELRIAFSYLQREVSEG